MSRPSVRNVLIVIGIWTLSKVLAFLITAFLIPLNNRLIFTGDAGIILLWLWEGLPAAVAAMIGAMVLVWVVETKKALYWVGTLALLYLYGGSLGAWRLIAHGWRNPPHTSDYIGISAQAIIPALACLIFGIWWMNRSSAPKPTVI